MRWRISSVCLSLGAALLCMGIAIFHPKVKGYWQEIWPESSIKSMEALSSALAMLGLLLIMLAVLPRDKVLVRLLALLFSAVVLFLGTKHTYDAAKEFLTPPQCSLGEKTHPCWYESVRGMLSVEEAIVNWLVWLSLLHSSFYLFRSSRKLLEKIWQILGYLLAAQTVIDAVDLASKVMAGVAHGDRLADLGTLLAFALLTYATRRPSFRARAQSCLASRGQQVHAAAAVSELMGKGRVDGILALARKDFRCVECSQISRESMAHNVPDPKLYAHSKKANLGDVDVFLSHSWHDDPDTKWRALQEWRTDFVALHRREPTLWIDKFCLDQLNIAEALACLPVFLSGCKTLLVLCGKTYLQRLWCVVELYVFLEMGGAESHLQLLILAAEARSMMAVHHEVDNFDAASATCHSEEDKERLLDVVEAGFGGLDHFSQAVRDILKSSGDRPSHAG